MKKDKKRAAQNAYEAAQMPVIEMNKVS